MDIDFCLKEFKMSADLTLKQKVQRTLQFSEINKTDLTGATFTFGMKANKRDTTYSIEKSDANFDKTDIATGIVYVGLTEDNLDLYPGTYWGELKITLTGDIDKTETFEIEIERAIITD